MQISVEGAPFSEPVAIRVSYRFGFTRPRPGLIHGDKHQALHDDPRCGRKRLICRRPGIISTSLRKQLYFVIQLRASGKTCGLEYPHLRQQSSTHLLLLIIFTLTL
jgi:hypothetical protein